MTTTQLKTARYYGHSTAALLVLLTLAEQGDLSMTRLAEEAFTSSANVTGLADTLCKQRLVKRTYPGNDRRSTTLALTELGRQRVYQITGRHMEPALG